MYIYIFEAMPSPGNYLSMRCLAGPFSTKREAKDYVYAHNYGNWRIISYPSPLKPGEVVKFRKRSNIYGHTEEMGPLLRQEVERQLLEDLKFYNVDTTDLHIDWSQTMPEGHATKYLDGRLENWDGILARDSKNNLVASGWLEFVHKDKNSPLFVFWQFLHLFNKEGRSELLFGNGIPQHILDKIATEE